MLSPVFENSSVLILILRGEIVVQGADLTLILPVAPKGSVRSPLVVGVLIQHTALLEPVSELDLVGIELLEKGLDGLV